MYILPDELTDLEAPQVIPACREATDTQSPGLQDFVLVTDLERNLDWIGRVIEIVYPRPNLEVFRIHLLGEYSESAGLRLLRRRPLPGNEVSWLQEAALIKEMERLWNEIS